MKKMLSFKYIIYLLRFTIFFMLAVFFLGCENTSSKPFSFPPVFDLEQWKLNDMDHDTLTNGVEVLHGLNPANSDSDSDFIPDNVELKEGSDPLNPDENMNGIVDGLDGDPLFAYQWYIHNDENQSICTTTDVETIAGNDLNILPLYHRTLGNTHESLLVQVVDGGVDAKHEDLDISLEHSLNSINGTQDPSPVEGVSSNPVQIFYRGHGTAVAGIIGAKGFNHIGIRGIAPKIRLAGSNWLESEEIEKLEAVWYSGNKANEIAISNNSWGTKFLDDKSYETIMKIASEELRDGLGRLFVFASGNEREDHSNANLSYLINNPYAIAVAALNHKDEFSSYSTPGSNILTSAYGGEHYYTAPTIMTTFSSGLSMTEDELVGSKGPITIDEDEKRDYTYTMNGTSAAAPMVSGALSLVLDVCPTLSWRDIRWLMAITATVIDKEQKEWVQNSAGLWHNNNYGFGRINPVDMVNMCLSPKYEYFKQQIQFTKNIMIDSRVIPDNNQSIDEEIMVEESLIIEWVAVTLNIDHPYAGDIDIELISPSGTVSHLMEANFLKYNAYKEGFRFSTVSLMGEHSKGRWILRVRDALDKDEGRLKSVTIEIRGHKNI